MRAFSFILLLLVGCSTIQEVEHPTHEFPKNAYLGKPDRPHKVIGGVRTKVEFPSLDPRYDFDQLCKNYFNKAAGDLLKRAKKNGADAVIEVESVVFLVDGRRETYHSAECADDGAEGQVLAQGLAVKWLPKDRKKD